MPNTQTQNAAREATFLVPTREQVESLHVGDLAINCFGRMAEVTEIFGRGNDVNGRAFVCYYTRMSDNGSVSQSMKEGQLVRTVATSNLHSSAELDAIERQINAERAAAT